MAKTVGQSYISKFYPERTKTASKSVSILHKLANDVQTDISSLSPEEQEQLAALVLEEMGEGQAQDQGQFGQPPMQPQAPVPQQAIQAPGQMVQNPSTPAEELQPAPGVLGGDPSVMQEKIAETIYLSDLFGKNAADKYWTRMQELQKMAEEQTVSSDIEQEFEQLAQQRAQEISQVPQEEAEKVALQYLIEKRAQEILASVS